MMPSVRYRLLEALLWRLDARKPSSATGESAHQVFERALCAPEPEPSEPRGTSWLREDVAGRPCWRLAPHNTKARGAILYLNGGGFMRPASRRDFQLAERLARHTGREVWLFCYPLEPHHHIHEVVESTLGAYQRILDAWDATQVALFGMSSGACLVLYLLTYLRHEGLELPMPARVVLNSPIVELPPWPAQLDRMATLDDTDCVIPACLLGPDGLISQMLEREPEEYLYLSHVLEADMRGWPPTFVTFGTNEVAYAYCDDFVRALKAASVPRRLVLARGCGHCAIHYAGTPEARELLRRECAFLRCGKGSDPFPHASEGQS